MIASFGVLSICVIGMGFSCTTIEIIVGKLSSNIADKT